MNLLQFVSENWNVLGLVVTVVAGYVLWQLSGRFVGRKEFETEVSEIRNLCERQGQSLGELKTTISQLNTTIANMPNESSLHRLELGLEELRGLQKETGAQLKGHLAAMERLNNNFDRLILRGKE